VTGMSVINRKKFVHDVWCVAIDGKFLM